MKKKKDLRWRVIYGYQPTDYISIGEKYLESAKYCMIAKKPFSCGNVHLSEGQIKWIEIDFRYYTGWYDTYKICHPSDIDDMKRYMPERELFSERETIADNRVKYCIATGNIMALKNPETIKLPENRTDQVFDLNRIGQYE